MNAFSVLSVSLGAACGALLRWGLSLQFNPVIAVFPLGTLASNLLGGYLVGLSVAWLGAHPDYPPEIRLFLITGFLGGLTTFSTYSAEVVGLLSQGELLWGAGVAFFHLVGSFALTALGIFSYRVWAA